MLVFLDESYEQIASGALRHVYAGFGVEERWYRGLVAALHKCKGRYYLAASGKTDDEIRRARATHIVTAGTPEMAEVKASKLLTSKQARFHEQYGSAPGILMANDMLGALAQGRATVFGVLSYPESVAALQDTTTQLPLPFIRVLERIEMWMEEKFDREYAIVVPDRVHDKIDHHLSAQMANFLYRATQGKRMRHIVPGPFWIDSGATAGSQYADLVAHILFNSMRPTPERKPIKELWTKVCDLEFRSLDGRTRGIRKLSKKTTGGSVAPGP